jgi:signal peptidase II
MTSSRQLRLAAICLVLVCTVSCDQVSKHIARAGLSDGASVTLPARFGEFRLAENRGSFLSLGDSLPESWRLALLTIGVAVGLLCLLLHLIFSRPSSWMSFIGLAAVWAGGTSNLLDRVFRHGRVTDFIFLSVGPIHTGIFNAADLTITFGVTLLVLSLCIRRNREGDEQA